MRTPSLLALLAAANTGLLLLFHWYVITTVGPGPETDAFYGALLMPQLVLAVMVGPIHHVLVPLLAVRTPESRGREAWTVVQGVALGTAIAAAALAGTAGTWVGWVFPGFDASGVELTVFLTRLQLAAMMGNVLTGILGAVHHATGRFVKVEVALLTANLVGLLVLGIVLDDSGVTGASGALVARSFLPALLLLPGLGPYHRPSWRDPMVGEAWRRLRPLLLGAVYYKSDLLVDRLLASLAASGDLSLYHLGVRVHGAVHVLLNRSLAMPAVPRLARAAAAADWARFHRIGRRRATAVLVVTGAILAAALIAGRPVLAWVFEHRNFGPDQGERLWEVVVALGGMLVAAPLAGVLTAAFYAAGDTLTPTRVGVFGFTVGIALKVGGFRFGGLLGLAAGTSLYYLLNAVVLGALLERGRIPRRFRGPATEDETNHGG